MRWLVIWAVCAALAALVATSKGRSGVGWFLIGLLLGPFAFLLSLGVSPRGGGPRPDATVIDCDSTDVDMRSCPFCAETIRKEAVVCRYCRRDIPRAQIDSTGG